MAYSFQLSPPTTRIIDDRRHVSITVTETDVGAADEWSVEVPPFLSLTLFEAELTDAGTAATIDPDLGLAAGFTADSLNAIVNNATPGTYIRTQDYVRISAPDRLLVGRSTPAGGTAAEVVSRVSWVEGHI